jgi:hypothetical protein
MPKSPAQSEKLWKEIGRVVLYWNDLELRLRRILHLLSNDWFSVALLTADMQSVTLIQTVRIFAAEHDVDSGKPNKLLDLTRDKVGHNLAPKESIFKHVKHVCDCADRLRAHRNLYAHCVTSPTKDVPRYTVSGWTTRNRGRLAQYDVPLNLGEMRKIAKLMTQAISYAERVENCIRQSQDSNRKTPVKWPKQIDLPDQLEKLHTTINETLSLF